MCSSKSVWRKSTLVLFILIFIQMFIHRYSVVSAASTNNAIQQGKQHARTKRTPPFPFPFVPASRRFGPIRVPAPPLIRPFPLTRPPRFGIELEPTRFGPSMNDQQFFDRGLFRRPFRSFGAPVLPRQRPLGRAVGRAPVIVETPDGTQTVFIRDRGVNLPNWSSNRNTPANRRGSGSLGSGGTINGNTRMSSGLGVGTNPIPTCSSGTVLRCRPWPAGRNPATAHRCYGDCPGRTCLVNCICTCDVEQGPRIMVARVIAPFTLRDKPMGVTRDKPMGVTSGVTNTDASVIRQGNIDQPQVVSGVDVGLSSPGVILDGIPSSGVNLGSTPNPGVTLGALSIPDVTVDSAVMGVPVPLPELGLTTDNTATNLDVTFTNTFDVNPSINVDLSDGALSTSTNIVTDFAMEAPSGKIEVNLKTQGPSFKVEGGPEVELSARGLTVEGARVGGIPITDVEISPAGLSGVSGVLDQSMSDLVLPNTSLDPSLDLLGSVTDSLTDPLQRGSIDVTITGNDASMTIGSAPRALALTLPAPGPAPAPPIKPNGLDIGSQPATTIVNTKTESGKPQTLDTVLQAMYNANRTEDPLTSLLLALRGDLSVDTTVGSGLDNTAVLSTITGDAEAPLDRLDLLVKDIGLSALFPGGKIDRMLATRNGNTNADSVATGTADSSLRAMLQTLLATRMGGNDISDKAGLALLAKTIGEIGQHTVVGNAMPLQSGGNMNSTLASQMSGSKGPINNMKTLASHSPGSKGSTNSVGEVLRKGQLMPREVPGNVSAADHTGATTKECLSKGLEIWCDPVTPWEPTPGVTKWCLLNCRDKNNCDRQRCSCICIEEKLFRLKFEKLPIKSP